VTEAKPMHDIILNHGETVRIGDIEVTIVRVESSKVRLGITAPTDVAIHRKEAFLSRLRQNWPDEAQPATPKEPT
jgi:carbon storage regulator CsrA